TDHLDPVDHSDLVDHSDPVGHWDPVDRLAQAARLDRVDRLRPRNSPDRAPRSGSTRPPPRRAFNTRIMPIESRCFPSGAVSAAPAPRRHFAAATSPRSWVVDSSIYDSRRFLLAKR